MTQDTTPLFWDCECAGMAYIHTAKEDFCNKCSTHRTDDWVPDSHIHEVKESVQVYLKGCTKEASYLTKEAMNEAIKLFRGVPNF